jgi:predicted Fe-Mo cluster-binding NifX family protein
MIIAIASNENHLKAVVDQHFGRCDWFCLWDTESGESQFIENPVRHHQEKAGCDAVAFLIEKNVKMAVAGRFGSKVVDEFRKNNVQMVVPQSQQSIEQIINQINRK